MRSVSLTPKAFEQLAYWIREDRRIASRILELIEDIQRDPFRGKGKPEPLRHDFKGLWSRRVTDEHRLIYRVDDEQIVIAACRFHYDK